MDGLFVALAIILSWIGHGCVWTAVLNNLYGRPLPKELLRWWRYATALILLAFPFLLWSAIDPDYFHCYVCDNFLRGIWGRVVFVYAVGCLLVGLCVFPSITLERALRRPPAELIHEETRTLDLWPELGSQLTGDHKMAALTRLPGNGVFRIDFTDMTLALVDLPRAWDGLTILVLSDLHFHGTPSQAYFQRIIAELKASPPPDLLCLLGDYIDSDQHHEWIPSILGQLNAREAKLAILGNHDLLHDPERVRRELTAIGCTVLGNGFREIRVRGVRCLAIGHEGPWFKPGPDLAKAPAGLFRLCLSHTPDNFHWAQEKRISLMLSGHVHGGAIRIPVIGPIFVPSVFGRRFDSGVFEENGTTLVVSRGLSGREPLRFRCNPQVIRITLRKASR